MKGRSVIILAFMLLLGITMLPATTIAQTSTTGTVEGTVTDANGAVVPNAAITLSGPNLIRAQTTTSDADGAYRFSSVPPGRYVVEVASTAGFAAYKQENIEVNLSCGTSVNIVMAAAGSTGNVVDVVASAEID